MPELWEQLSGARVYDLGQPYFTGMPHWPAHPPFLFGLTKRHGDMVGPAGNSSAADAIALGSHVGTHIDALCHFSCGGLLHGGHAVEPLQSYVGGLKKFSVDTIAPILRRGVLLDLAPGVAAGVTAGVTGGVTAGVTDGVKGGVTARMPNGAPLAEDCEIAPEQLEAARKTEIRPGDVVLLRTGWGQYFEDARQFVNQTRLPGPGLAAARWLSARGIFAAGSDTVAFEKSPVESMPVHVHLLVESGIHIIECLNLEELAADGVTEFLFIGVPMKIRGATGAPLRPLAVVTGPNRGRDRG
jgi:kynurenine formamidase